MTPLQQYVNALRDLRADALDELTDREFEWFVQIGCDIFGHEAARLFIGRLIRDERDLEAA